MLPVLFVESGHTRQPEPAIACFYASFGFISTDTPYNNVLNGTYNTLSNSLPYSLCSTPLLLFFPPPPTFHSASTLPKLFYAIQKGIVHSIRKCVCGGGQVKENVDESCKRDENEQETSWRCTVCVSVCVWGGRIRIVRLIYLLFLLIEVPSITVCKQCSITWPGTVHTLYRADWAYVCRVAV